jgi:uncharacterized membrane protein YhhN
MTEAAWIVLGMTGVFAVLDWISRAIDDREMEYLAKPLTTVGLIGVALVIDPADPTVRAWFAGALLFGLFGDVFLMLPDEERFFPAGLGSFLIGHLFYVAGFVAWGPEPFGILVGVLVAGAAMATIGRRIVAGVAEQEPALRLPVIAYMAVISAMVVAAFGSWSGLAVAGALIFYASDSIIGWTKFVRPHPAGPVAIMVTYHVGQALLVLSLV